MEPLHVLKQMFPTEDLRRRVEYAKRGCWSEAKALRFTSEAGTDVTYQLGQYPVISEYGYTDEPGRWDHFPSDSRLRRATMAGERHCRNSRSQATSFAPLRSMWNRR